jgi:hypothetical protein
MTIPIFDFYSGNDVPPFTSLHARYGQLLYFRKFSMGGGPDLRIGEDAALIRGNDDLLGGHHWCDPTQNAARQADFFLREIERHKPIAIFYDVEQAWPWKTYAQLDYSKTLPANQILDNVVAIVERVNARAGLPYLIYTGRWFTIGYCPQLGPWIGAQPAMIASYPDYYFLWPKQEKPARMPYHLQDYDKITPRAASALEYLAWMEKSWMAVPTGCTNVKAWQISSRLILPECRVPYDLSRWEGTAEDFRSFLRLEPPAPPVYFGQLPAAEKFMVLERHLQKAGDVGQDGEVRI